MAEQDPTNLKDDKFAVTLKDGVGHPTDILASLQNKNSENQTITQNSPTSPPLPHTQDNAIINAEAAPSSILITSDDTVTPQDTALSPSSTAHDVSRPSMTPPAPFTLDSDSASTMADLNQASESLSHLPDFGPKPAGTNHTRSRSDCSSMESFGSVHERRSYELENAKDEIDNLKQTLDNAESKVTSMNHELDKAKTEITNLKHENAKDEIDNLKQTLDNAESNVISLSLELDKAKTEITNLKHDVWKQGKERSEMERVAITATNENSSLNKQVAASEFTIEKLEREQKKLKKELKEGKDQRRGKNDEMEDLEATVQEQKQSMESQNVLIKNLRQEVHDKDRGISYANGENEKLVREIQILQQRSKTQTGQVKGEGKKLADAQKEIKHLNEKHEKSMKELKQHVERLTMRVQTQPKTEFTEIKRLYAESLEHNTRLENDIEILRIQVLGLEDELRKVQTRADKAQEKLKKWADAKRAETAGEEIKNSHETPVKQQEGATDVPTVEHIAVSMSDEPGVTVVEEPKLPSADAEAKKQGSDAEIPELTGPQEENGETFEATDAAAIANANTLEKAEDHHKEESQEVDPFTEAHVSVERPATPRDKDHDDSCSSVCSTTELSIDNRTPRALRRTLGQEGIQSRAQSTATDFSINKCEHWIHRTSDYVDKGMQTELEPVKLMENMGMQTESESAKSMGNLMENMSTQTDPEPPKLMENWGMQTDPLPVNLKEDTGVQTDPEPRKLMLNWGTQTDPVPVKLMENMGTQTDPEPPKLMLNWGTQTDPEPRRLMENSGTQTDPVLVTSMEDMGVQTDYEPEGENGGDQKSKAKSSETHQARLCCKILSFLLLLMVLFTLGVCYCAWSSWSATVTERNLWLYANSAKTHGAMLHKNGRRTISALDPIFQQKM